MYYQRNSHLWRLSVRSSPIALLRPGSPPLSNNFILLPRSLEIALDPKARERDRIAAVRELLDRGWGKAVGYADIEGADPLALREVEAEIRAIAEQLRAER